MTESALVSIASIAVLGIGAQWLAWRLRLPAILLLLLAGFFAGPITGLVKPDELLGDSLFPVVSLAVGIILFEGGLTLKLEELRNLRKVVFLLISIGAFITWVVGTLAAYWIVGMTFQLSLVVGAIFIVTGPTVVLPLLRQVRPRGQVAAVLKWEGILIDPVGATVAVLVLEGVLAVESGDAPHLLLLGMGETLAAGAAIGLVAGFVLVQLLKRFWVPDFLQNPISLMFVVAAFTLADEIMPEAGLLATTVMGIYLANQHAVSVKHIVQFKEDLGILLLSSLFIVLAARLQTDTLSNLGLRGIGFLAVLMLIGRPLAVLVSTLGSPLTWSERAFTALLAPRGIVAVSVASLFALELHEVNYAGYEQIVPLTFLVVVGTVTIYGLSAGRLTRLLKLSQPQANGLLIVGAQDWACEMAKALIDGGCCDDVLLVDSNWDKVSAAKLDGLPVVYASILSETALNEIDTSRIGRLLALTSNDEVNSLAALRFTDMFGRANVFQLPLHNAEKRRHDVSLEQHLVGRSLFGSTITYTYLERRFEKGAVIKMVKLTREFPYEAFRRYYGPTAIPLFLVEESGRLTVLTADNGTTPRAGQTLIALVDPVAEPRVEDVIPADAGESLLRAGERATIRP